MNNFPGILIQSIPVNRRYRVDQHRRVIDFGQMFDEVAVEIGLFVGETERRALQGIQEAAYAYFQHHKACGNQFANREWGIEVTGITPINSVRNAINIRWNTAWVRGPRYPVHGSPEDMIPLGYFNEYDLYLAAQPAGLPYTLIARYGHRDAYISMPVAIMSANAIDTAPEPLFEAYQRAVFFGYSDLITARA